MIERRILTELLEVTNLPTLPEVMSKILETVEDEHSSASDLTTLLESDHAISARVLRLANSAFYGLRHKAESVRRAVVVIGFDAVRHLALATAVFDALSQREQFALDPEDFWMHSLGAAKAAQMLCREHCTVRSPEGAFTAGLLHDIGKYTLALVLKEEYREVVQAAQAAGRPLRELELENLNTTHAEVGKWIAAKWRFPALIVDAIGYLDSATTYVGPNKTEVAIVALASDMSRVAGFGYAGDWSELPFDRDLLNFLELTDAIIDDIIAELSQLRDETRQFLNLLSES